MVHFLLAGVQNVSFDGGEMTLEKSKQDKHDYVIAVDFQGGDTDPKQG